MPFNWSALGIQVPSNAYGKNIKVRCPKDECRDHDRRDRPLSINIVTGLYLCHHCGWSGIAPQERDFEFAPARVKPIVKYKAARPLPSELPDSSVMERMYKSILEERGISRQVLESNGVYPMKYVGGQMDGKWCFVFPFIKNGAVVNNEYRFIPKAFRLDVDAERPLWRHDHIVPGGTLIVTEGKYDALSIVEAGFDNVVSVPGGASENLFRFFDEDDGTLQSLDKVVIATDNDVPGFALREELLRRFGPEKCYTVEWPEDCKDANDVLVKHGKEVLAACLIDAAPPPIEGLHLASEYFAAVDDLIEGNLYPGITIEDPILSASYKAREGELTIITGVPSHGKSSWLDWYAYQATLQGWGVAVCSPEHPPERHLIRLLSLAAKKQVNSKKDQYSATKEEIETAKGYVTQKFFFIEPPNECSIAAVLKIAGGAVKQRGIKGLILDPWNEFTDSFPIGVSPTHNVSRALSELKKFARQHKIHIWLVAHPRKVNEADKGKYAGRVPPPNPYAIADSANFYNKADNIICIWRDTEVKGFNVEVHIMKIKWEENGKLDIVSMQFDPSTRGYKSTTSETLKDEFHDALQ